MLLPRAYTDAVPTMRLVEPVGVWWLRLLMLAIGGFFGWVEWVGVTSQSPTAHPYITLPLYVVYVYWTLAALVNRQVVEVRAGVFRKWTGPLPMERWERVERDQIRRCYFFRVLVTPDEGGEPFAITFTSGVETRQGRQIVVDEHKTLAVAQERASLMAAALNEGATGELVEVSELFEPKDDPLLKRLTWLWVGICAVALVMGLVWEFAIPR